jgi:hypothetical protein
MSTVPQYKLTTDPGQQVIPQLLRIQEWTLVKDGIKNSFGPDLNRPQE